MICVEHLRLLVIRTTLNTINLYSESAENLLLGICAHESRMGTFLKQYTTDPKVPDGVALGIYQMEPKTYYDIWDNVINPRGGLKKTIMRYCQYPEEPSEKRLIDDLRLATIMCRCQFIRYKESLPEKDDVEGLAKYWKQYYNRSEDDNIEQFIINYKTYIERE